MFKERFNFLYVVLGIALCVPYALVALNWNRVPATVAKKVDLAALHAQLVRSQGDQNLAALCEANLTQAVQAQYGKVTAPYKLVSIKPGKDRDSVKVTVHLSSSIYSGNLSCELHRSTWTVGQVAPAS